MPRFFVRQNQITDETVTLLGEDAHHVARSLRMAIGDELFVCDMQGNEYRCQIEAFCDDREVAAHILSVKPSENEPCCRIRLYQALPKGDKLDTIIQKAVECGVTEIIPFQSERCIARMKPEAEERKKERRQRIAEEAAKQCGRSVIPEVHSTVDFDEMLSLATRNAICLFCYEGDGTQPLGRVMREVVIPDASGGFPNISVIIGSEGGFSVKEAQCAVETGMISVGLGKRILRTETASGFVLACLVCATELDDHRF